MHQNSRNLTLHFRNFPRVIPQIPTIENSVCHTQTVYQQADLIAVWRLTRRHDAMVRGENFCTAGVRPTEDRLMMALDGSDSWSLLNPTYSPWNRCFRGPALSKVKNKTILLVHTVHTIPRDRSNIGIWYLSDTYLICYNVSMSICRMTSCKIIYTQYNIQTVIFFKI